MKPVTHIALVYTALTVGVLTLAAMGMLLFQTGWVWVGLIIGCAFFVYWAGRRYAQRMISRIDEAYDTEKTFISNASHELNNPLTAIQGECEITLLKERTPLEYQLALQRIASETGRIIRLMQSLLFLSKGEGELLKSGVEPVFLAEFLMKSVRNRVTFAPDNFALVVQINPALLKIAIDNILQNALKYSPEEKPVEMRLRGSVLEIRDYGIGIADNDLKQIAQPFFRAGNARGYTGHGIGLSLSIHILNTYGAKVTISSVLNEGTSIQVDFS